VGGRQGCLGTSPEIPIAVVVGGGLGGRDRWIPWGAGLGVWMRILISWAVRLTSVPIIIVRIYRLG
jgi:hypothetical protein